jgi:molybdopterin molybdotransferase
LRNSDDYPLLSVEQALEHVLATVAPLPVVEAPILAALDHVLAEDVYAPSDVPPHANSAMDGYAVRYADLEPGVELPVMGSVAAGHPWVEPLRAGQALRIMTGAPLPTGADTVVRFEDATLLDEDGLRVRIDRVPRQGRNVRLAGEDVRAGQQVLTAGARLRPQEIGMLASLGKSSVRVHRRPLVAVLSTGDEVASLGQSLAPGQVYDINTYTVAAQIVRAGGEPLVLAPAPDREGDLTARLRTAMRQADLIVTSGGVSVGDFDLVKQVLVAEGRMDFWWVNMKPGKPLAFGRLGTVPLLALPGNPVAAMLSFHLFGRPALLKMRGLTAWEAPSLTAVLADPVARKDGRRHYLRVWLEERAGQTLAHLTGDQGSGILSSLTVGRGVAVIPEDCDHLAAGATVTVLLMD